MTLIWAEGPAGGTLASLWRDYARLQARATDRSLPAAERGQALVRAEAAQDRYERAAVTAAAELAQVGQARTHVLVVGVGHYQRPNIPALTTSVHGARKFAEWMLTRFHNPKCPLGSAELLLSPGGLGDWAPGETAAARLGLAAGDTLPVEAATFVNVKAAFERWITRAGHRLDNAAFCYFSGHGVWKLNPLFLPEDAVLPSDIDAPARLIDIRRMQQYLYNQPPRSQYFFIDSCQEILFDLLVNLAVGPGVALREPTDAAALEERECWAYLGSYIGRSAYGPSDDAPFFTQELLRCLEARGAASHRVNGQWRVTTNSLREALEAAALYRSEQEGQAIQFSVFPEHSSFTGVLCLLQGQPEVFVQVRCEPHEHTGRGRLYLGLAGGARLARAALRAAEWFTAVPLGSCQAGVEFDPGVALNGAVLGFAATPTVFPVEIAVAAKGAGGGS